MNSITEQILNDWGTPEKDQVLPSQHQLGDKVKVFLMPEGESEFPGFNAKVLAIHFYESKVKYDLEINFYGDYSSRIYNVDSVLVTKL